MTVIEMGKKCKSRGGYPATVYSTTLRGGYPVAANIHYADHDELVRLTSDGAYIAGGIKSTYDIFEVHPLEDVPIDAPVWVNQCGRWEPRHFAGIHNGNAYTWDDGYTSHTTKHKTAWEISLTNPNAK